MQTPMHCLPSEPGFFRSLAPHPLAQMAASPSRKLRRKPRCNLTRLQRRLVFVVPIERLDVRKVGFRLRLFCSKGQCIVPHYYIGNEIVVRSNCGSWSLEWTSHFQYESTNSVSCCVAITRQPICWQ
jgi:hypothetical protein